MKFATLALIASTSAIMIRENVDMSTEVEKHHKKENHCMDKKEIDKLFKALSHGKKEVTRKEMAHGLVAFRHADDITQKELHKHMHVKGGWEWIAAQLHRRMGDHGKMDREKFTKFADAFLDHFGFCGGEHKGHHHGHHEHHHKK